MIEDDAVVGFQAIARDITERKLAQQALGESERRFREVLEKVDLLAATIDAEGRIIFCNDFLLALTGRQGEEVLGKNWFHIFVGEEQREAQVKAHREFMSQGEIPLHRENEIVKRDGSALLIRWTNTLLHDLYGKVIGATGIGEDITEKRQAEDALRESEEKYRKILETIVDGYHESDLEGNLTLVNDSLCRIGGYSREELVGVNYRLLMDSHDAKLVSSAYNDVYRTGKANPGIGFQIIRKDGEKRHVVVSVAPARDKGGNPCGFRGIFRDVTDQIQLQRQLLQAQKMEAIGTLAGGIAHDFNNLLMIILGYSDMLLHGRNPGDKAYDALRHIRQAATEGGDLVKRILAFSRKIEPEFRLMDLNQEIRRIHNLLNRTIPKMIETELILDQDLRTVKADPVLLEHVVLNLAVNAQHAMPEGGRLVIETQNVTLREDYCRNHLEVKPGKYVMLSVSDTGEGIEKDIQDRIFDPFFTTKEEEGGTGLGLSMVHGIVTLHGGHVRCYSEPRLGTIFKVYLPVVPGEVLSGVDTTMEMPAFGSETILLVDDETRVREIAADLLAMAGYTVLTAGNGLEALEVYQQNRGEISLVILDLIMPKMGGKQCLEELLKIDPDVKVLVATGYSANGPTKAIVEAGAKASIIKPFDMKMLLKAVRDALDEI